MSTLRTALTGRSADLVLAVIGLAVTQFRIVQIAESWQHARLALPVFVALAPALIAVRRVDPVLAAVGLAAGSIGSLLLGQLSWVLLAGCALALWSLPTRCRLGTAVATTLAVAGLTVVAASKWVSLLNWAYPSIYSRFTDKDGVVETTSGLTQHRYDQIQAMPWRWWLAALLLLIGLAAVAYWRRGAVPPTLRTAGERLDDLRVFLLDKDRVWALDTVLAFVAASVVLLEIRHDQVVGNWWSAPKWMPCAVAATALTLVLRRRRPVVPVALLMAGAMVAYWQMFECWTVLGALAIALYSLATGRALRFSLPVATVVLAAAPAIATVIRYPQMVLIFPALKRQYLTSGDMHDPPDNRLHNTIYEEMVDRQWPITLSLILVLAVFVGVLARLNRRNRSAAAREAELEQRAVEQDAAQVVLTERSHIARDLHDVVAHAVNLMVIQAETGPDLLKRGDADALAGFQRIGDAGRRALGELDRMLSALRDAAGVPDPALSPQPGLDDLGPLAKSLSDQGLPVEFELRGSTDGVPDGIQLTAYRLVQEALTNVAKHAKADGAKILIERGETGVAVQVVDDGQGFDPATRPDGRHGLTGMQERVRIHNGTLSIRSSPGDGATVSAWLPVATR